jgi:dihydropteroate synthase
MLNVQIIDFTLSSTRELYAKYYVLSGDIQLHEYSGYEFFATDAIDTSLVAKISKNTLLKKPAGDYLPNVYGLFLQKKNSPYPEELSISFPELSALLRRIENKDASKGILHKAGKSLATPFIMGILNITPDSFSDGGRFNTLESAMKRVGEMIADEVDIIDVGGESTRPGAESVSVEEELQRVIPVIQAIKRVHPSVLISIDTNKSDVAVEAVKSGAALVNDISGGTFDSKMFEAVAGAQAAYCIMHTPALPKTMQQNIHYTNIIAEIYHFLAGQSTKAQKAGIKDIFIDPGIGFGKTIENNYEILSRIHEFHTLGFPILIGASRKSFLGKSLDLQVNERDIASSLVDMFAVSKGVQIIRTHNTSNAQQLKKICQLLHTHYV